MADLSVLRSHYGKDGTKTPFPDYFPKEIDINSDLHINAADYAAELQLLRLAGILHQ